MVFYFKIIEWWLYTYFENLNISSIYNLFWHKEHIGSFVPFIREAVSHQDILSWLLSFIMPPLSNPKYPRTTATTPEFSIYLQWTMACLLNPGACILFMTPRQCYTHYLFSKLSQTSAYVLVLTEHMYSTYACNLTYNIIIIYALRSVSTDARHSYPPWYLQRDFQLY